MIPQGKTLNKLTYGWAACMTNCIHTHYGTWTYISWKKKSLFYCFITWIVVNNELCFYFKVSVYYFNFILLTLICVAHLLAISEDTSMIFESYIFISMKLTKLSPAQTWPLVFKHFYDGTVLKFCSHWMECLVSSERIR